MTDKVLEAVREASISIACLMDDCDFVQINDQPVGMVVLEKDIHHIQDQLTIIENYLDPAVVWADHYVAETEEMKDEDI
jgi:hypothetical protein